MVLRLTNKSCYVNVLAPPPLGGNPAHSTPGSLERRSSGVYSGDRFYSALLLLRSDETHITQMTYLEQFLLLRICKMWVNHHLCHSQNIYITSGGKIEL